MTDETARRIIARMMEVTLEMFDLATQPPPLSPEHHERWKHLRGVMMRLQAEALEGMR